MNKQGREMDERLRQALELDRHRAAVENGFEYRKWVTEIPDLDFPADWSFRPIPPFGGAIARFLVKRADTGDGWVSVYLDCYGNLGATYQPYWEVYPSYDGDAEWCAMQEVGELKAAIKAGLDVLAIEKSGS